MDNDKIKQIVLDIIAEIAPDEDLSDVKPEQRLRDQLDLDVDPISLDALVAATDGAFIS